MKIGNDIYYVGVNDHQVDLFEGQYVVPNGMSYNSYVIKDEKIALRVADLDALLAALRTEGCNVLGDSESSEFGKFGWVIDPEGHKVELWEPPSGQ